MSINSQNNGNNMLGGRVYRAFGVDITEEDLNKTINESSAPLVNLASGHIPQGFDPNLTDEQLREMGFDDRTIEQLRGG